MNATTLRQLFEYNFYCFQVNTEGLSQAESLIQPPAAGNCMNWVVGHALASRNTVFRLLGETPAWDPAVADRYERGSRPITGDAEAVPLADILAQLARSQQRLLAALDGLAPERLAAPVGKRTLGEELAFLQFHEAYHAGQTGLLRRMAGKEGAIK